MTALNEEPDFSQPWKVSDVVLLVEEVRLHVHSGVLAMWSPVLENMCTDLKRKNSKTLLLDDQKAHEVRELLLLIYPTVQKPVTEQNCYFFLELARQFEMSKVTEKCQEYLLGTVNSSSEVVDLLTLSAKYNLTSLREECLRLAKQIDWKSFKNHKLYKQIELTDYREIAEQKINSLQIELEALKEKASSTGKDDSAVFNRQRQVSNAPSSSTVNAGLASPIFPRKQVVQPRPQRSKQQIKVVFNSSINVPATAEAKKRPLPPEVPKRTHYPIKPIVKEF